MDNISNVFWLYFLNINEIHGKNICTAEKIFKNIQEMLFYLKYFFFIYFKWQKSVIFGNIFFQGLMQCV